MSTVAESVPPRQYPIHLTREYRASLDLDHRPTAMRLPQVIKRHGLTSRVSDRIFRDTSPFRLVCPVHCVRKKVYRAEIGGRGCAVTANGPFPSVASFTSAMLYSTCCSGGPTACVSKMVHPGNLRTIYLYRNNLNYPLPAFLASTSLYIHMEHKTSSRHPVKLLRAY